MKVFNKHVQDKPDHYPTRLKGAKLAHSHVRPLETSTSLPGDVAHIHRKMVEHASSLMTMTTLRASLAEKLTPIDFG